MTLGISTHTQAWHMFSVSWLKRNAHRFLLTFIKWSQSKTSNQLKKKSKWCLFSTHISTYFTFDLIGKRSTRWFLLTFIKWSQSRITNELKKECKMMSIFYTTFYIFHIWHKKIKNIMTWCVWMEKWKNLLRCVKNRHHVKHLIQKAPQLVIQSFDLPDQCAAVHVISK